MIFAVSLKIFCVIWSIITHPSELEGKSFNCMFNWQICQKWLASTGVKSYIWQQLWISFVTLAIPPGIQTVCRNAKASSGVHCEGFSNDLLGWVTRLAEIFLELLWGTFCPCYMWNLQDDHHRGWRCCLRRRIGRGWVNDCFSCCACRMRQLEFDG